MIGVLIIPTGLGAAIGGNAGDGNPVAKLIAGCCDTLVTHPNVVNASDINEMTENTLYVEGSMLDRFLGGEIGLRRVCSYNRILVVANPPLTDETINAVSAARATIGIDVTVLELKTPFRMVAHLHETHADGEVFGLEQLLEAVGPHSFDALAIHTPIEVPRDVALNYYRNGGINPWGGVEAKASRLVATALNKPVAHAPLESTSPDDEELYFIFQRTVDPRIAAEAVSNCYLHCVLKGLHRAPQIVFRGESESLSVGAVDFLLSPYGCWGTPHRLCRRRAISGQQRPVPIIAVRENTIHAPVSDAPVDIAVDSYLEAAGLIMSMRAGVNPVAVRRELPATTAYRPWSE